MRKGVFGFSDPMYVRSVGSSWPPGEEGQFDLIDVYGPEAHVGSQMLTFVSREIAGCSVLWYGDVGTFREEDDVPVVVAHDRRATAAVQRCTMFAKPKSGSCVA